MTWWEWILLIVGGAYAVFLIVYVFLMAFLGVALFKNGLWR